MEIFPILFIHHDSGVIGMYEKCFATLELAEAKIEELNAEGKGYEYVTKSIKLEVTWN